jgi:hypothetical protein
VKLPVCLTAALLGLLCVNFCSSARAQDPGVAPPPDLPQVQVQPGLSANTVVIPGPLRSFLRMAGISQKIHPEDVLPLLSRNVFTEGYQGRGRPTEFLILLIRYVQQARELTALRGPDGMIRVSNCEGAGPLLHVLGYRPRRECGQGQTALETSDSEKAFLTVDSGFPLPELERTLQGGKPFAYGFSGTPVPVIFSEAEWPQYGKKNQAGGSLIDVLLHDPDVARLYWAFSRLDVETAAELKRSPGIRKLLPYAALLDFYGGHLHIRAGRVVVPGGDAAQATWKDLAGASPAAPGEFVPRLMEKDKGWLAAYFDVLLRTNLSQQAHFTQPNRLKRFYEGLRVPEPSDDASKGAFRPAPGLLMLATRTQWEANGEALVPGNLEVWKGILRQKSDSSIIRAWGKRVGRLNTPDELMQAMFGLSRANTDAGPLQTYLALSAIDIRRPAQHRLAPETVRVLARKFVEFSDQYRIFAEFPQLSDASITSFLSAADSLDSISNGSLRGNALGMFQANVGLWQILARQGQIPSDQLNPSWQYVVHAFAKVRSAAQVYDAGCASLAELLRVTTGKGRASQDQIIDLLAGPPQSNPEARAMHQEIANRIRSVLEGQRLVSVDALLAIGDGLRDKQAGKPVSDGLLALAAELREFEMPQPIFSSGERTEWAAGVYNNRHTDIEMHTDLTKAIKLPVSASQLEEARGQLASFLRDTLVGLNYAYYEPPGAQALHNNPLLVRSHDFSAETVGGIKAVWQAPRLFGEGSPAGGGAHLVGSLADLPYVLAEMEQDFIAPENVQALIWRELVPGLLTSAVLPRWWDVSSEELRAITLYQKAGEELLASSTEKEALRGEVLTILSDRMLPQNLERVEQALGAGHMTELPGSITPADCFYLAAEFRRSFPERTDSWGAAGQELEDLHRKHPQETSWERLSRDFGVPHPTLSHTYGRELLNLAPFPAFSGYSSRLMAESWDSTNLYWARLADEAGQSPVMLNRLVPELTRRMVEKISATDFEDWPAVLRAMRETAEEYRQGKATHPTVASTAREH